MNKVTKKREEELFSTELEEQNLKNFKELLPYFYLNDKTVDRLLNSLDPDTRTEKDNAFDLVLGLNTQRRRWFIVEPTINLDKSYSMYSRILSKCQVVGNSYVDDEYCYDMIQRYNLLDYEVYKSGKVIIEGQEFKLFKFLLGKKILDSALIHQITSGKPPKENIYFCISRNPIDYLFCATNQSFKSCESLESTHNGAFYMGLGGLSLDPNRCIMFLTNSKVLDYKTKGLSFNHFSYISRSWGIWIEDDKIYIIRYYPHEVVPFNELLIDINIHSYMDPPNNIKSKHKFLMPRFKDKSKSFIFLDHLGLSSNTSGHFYDSYNGYTGCIEENFNWDRGFEEANTWEDLINGSDCTCMECGERIREDDQWNNAEGDIFCFTCYHNIHTECDSCRSEIRLEESYACDDGDYILCPNCFNGFGVCCNDCGDLFYKQHTYSIIDEGYVVCETCIGNYKFCDECETYYNKYCPDCSPYCHKCEKHYIDVCDCQLKLEGI